MNSTVSFRSYLRVLLNEKTKTVFICRPITDQDKGKIYELEDYGLELIQLVSTSIYTLHTIIDMVTEKYPDKGKEIMDMIHFLKKMNYIIEKENEIVDPIIAKRYSRIIPLWSEFESNELTSYDIQRKIMNTKVAVIGCGTIGTNIVSSLMTYGIHNFVLIDDDKVDETNLTRQPVFAPKDIGNYKVDVLKSYISNHSLENPNISTIRKKITNINDFEELVSVDLVVYAADGSNILKIVSDDHNTIENLLETFSLENDIPISFTGGYQGHSGRIFPIMLPRQTHKLSCFLSHFIENETHHSFPTTLNNHVKLSTTTDMARYVSSIISFEIIKVISGVIPIHLRDKLMYTEFGNYTNKSIHIEKTDNLCTCNFEAIKIH